MGRTDFYMIVQGLKGISGGRKNWFPMHPHLSLVAVSVFFFGSSAIFHDFAMHLRLISILLSFPLSFAFQLASDITYLPSI